MAYTNINDPSAYFQTVLWTGDGLDNKQITNDGNSDLQPDWVWLKDRTQAESHAVFDSTRGATVRLQTNNPNAESTETATLKSFTTDGFTVGTSGTVNNGSNPDQYVAWQWKANAGLTSSNTDGSITSTVQANQDAGFSIVTYTGTGSISTVGHGLGVQPDVMILKNRDTSVRNWIVYHKDTDASANYFLRLNTTDAKAYSGGRFNGTHPTSSVFTVGTSSQTNGSGDGIVAYCFASKQGYSKFGSYIGNGSTNGPFVYTGFKPAFVMYKRTDQPVNWDMFTGKISPFNKITDRLRANLPDAENTGLDRLNFLSNGFKMINNHTSGNTSGGTYIYMAFAENPFTTSTGIPTTAR